MPVLFVFLLKVNIALLVFCAGYYFVLRHLTFYTLNRIYLVTAILFASIYPQINLSGFFQQHQQIGRPVQAMVFSLQAPATAFIKPFEQPNYWQWAETVFWAGAILFALRLIVQLFSLYRIYRSSTAAHIYGHDVRVINSNGGPFSFWKSIYVNPALHEPADLKSILQHEQVHVNEWHTLDILVAELSAIFYWFNPGIWLMKKAIRENIEYITDNKILKNGADTKQYQYSLVNVSFAAAPQGIVNHFNISTIKKRIIMMNAKRSSKIKLTRYALLVPAVVALLLVFSISKAAYITKSNNIGKHLLNNVKTSVMLTVKNIAALAKTSSTPVKNNPVTAKTIDTIRKGSFFLSTSHHSDSLNYVINGTKASKADFAALDPKQIYSMEVMPAKEAKKVYDGIDNKNDVLFVTTDGSEAGKKFKEKIDHSYTVNGGGVISVGGFSSNTANSTSISYLSNSSDSSKSKNVTVTGSGVIAVETAPKVYAFKVSPKVAHNLKIDSIHVNGKGGEIQKRHAVSSELPDI
jgi:bla regulator protein BlaR1